MTDDDRAVMKRLAALEAEVKAEGDAQRARKEAALAGSIEDRGARGSEARSDGQRGRRVAGEPRVTNAADRGGRAVRKPAPAESSTDISEDDGDRLEDLGGALELASKANRVKRELQRKRKKGEKSWVVSGVASLALGPVGWLYAGSWREAVPATAVWVVAALLASKILPVFLMLPVLMVALPLSAIAGVVYALQYNRSGRRERLFDRDEPKKPKQLDRG